MNYFSMWEVGVLVFFLSTDRFLINYLQKIEILLYSLGYCLYYMQVISIRMVVYSDRYHHHLKPRPGVRIAPDGRESPRHILAAVCEDATVGLASLTSRAYLRRNAKQGMMGTKNQIYTIFMHNRKNPLNRQSPCSDSVRPISTNDRFFTPVEKTIIMYKVHVPLGFFHSRILGILILNPATCISITSFVTCSPTRFGHMHRFLAHLS